MISYNQACFLCSLVLAVGCDGDVLPGGSVPVNAAGTVAQGGTEDNGGSEDVNEGGAAGSESSGGVATGGARSGGVSGLTGGSLTGGRATGGAGVGGTLTGGANTGGLLTGGVVAQTGGTATGGLITGGTAVQTGGISTGGLSTGGNVTGGNDAGGNGVCGDGIVQYIEVCDDGNTASGDGCFSTCSAVETGWACPTPGAPCRPVCGDDLLRGDEQCEDNDTVPTSGDGCNVACRIEQGYDCPTVGEACVLAECGNGDPEYGEGCDDGNFIAGDGCSPACQNEPAVTVGPDPVVHVFCGDGMVMGTEECDDGNTASDDGCSADCVVENGFDCESNLPSTFLDNVQFSVIYRDFKGTNETGGHPHMKQNRNNNDAPPYNGADKGIVGAICATDTQETCGRLNALGKPELAQYDNLIENHPTIYWHPEDFALWYDTAALGIGENGAIEVNETISTITLSHNGTGQYVFENIEEFFPLDNIPGTLGITPEEDHNFHFTTEIRYFFQYWGGEVFSFSSDDDVWVYINGRLAVDLGGIHLLETALVSLDSGGRDTRFMITAGNVYEIAMFQAERHPFNSVFNFTLGNFILPRSYCGPICGDELVVGWEVCDEGVENNVGEYGHCNADCSAIQYCGDGIQQAPYEECDDGNNVGELCAPGCFLL